MKPSQSSCAVLIDIIPGSNRLQVHCRYIIQDLALVVPDNNWFGRNPSFSTYSSVPLGIFIVFPCDQVGILRGASIFCSNVTHDVRI